MQANRLRGLVAAVVMAAAASLMLLPGLGSARDPTTLVVLGLLSALAGARPIHFAQLRTSLTATHPVILCALALLGPGPAVLVALAGVAGAVLVRVLPMRPLRVAFNVGSVVLSTAAAALTFDWLGGVTGGTLIEVLLPLLAATTVYFLANTSLVALAVGLEQGRSFLDTWRTCFEWTAAASYFMGLTLSALLLLAMQTLGPWGVLLLLPPVWLLTEHYRAQWERLTEKQRRIEAVEQLNGELESKIEDLRAAMTRIKRLEGLLPICSHCKKIRDEGDNWQRLEQYIIERSAARFTHSVCPACREAHFPTPVKV